MDVKIKIQKYSKALPPCTTLVAVSKTKPNSLILEAYDHGHRDFGENKVQEICKKNQELPDDIKWHFVGHLQRNKVKLIVPFIHLIHSVDSIRLMDSIEKEASKIDRRINILLQLHIAKEESKFGFDYGMINDLITDGIFNKYKFLSFKGLMGMATNTSSIGQVREEFSALKSFYDFLRKKDIPNFEFLHLSMGMSGDYKVALEEGSNMVRIGSDIFGARNYG